MVLPYLTYPSKALAMTGCGRRSRSNHKNINRFYQIALAVSLRKQTLPSIPVLKSLDTFCKHKYEHFMTYVLLD